MEQIEFYTLIIKDTEDNTVICLDFYTKSKSESDFKVSITESMQTIVKERNYNTDTIINNIIFKDVLNYIYNIENLRMLLSEMEKREFMYNNINTIITLSTEDLIGELANKLKAAYKKVTLK